MAEFEDFLSFLFIRKIVAVLPLACCGSSGKRGNALAALGLKSFKVVVKKEGLWVVSRFGYLRLRSTFTFS
jgi:hypothetical protein